MTRRLLEAESAYHRGSDYVDPHREPYDPHRSPYPRLLPTANLMPQLPGLTALAGSLKTYAPSPVWRDSTTQPVRFAPLPRRKAVRLYHDARRFDRQTRQPGKHGGAVGHAALQVLHTLVFDCLNYASGRLDPSYEGIARRSNLSRATVGRALVRLRELGILNWIRRCLASMQDGRFVLDQDTNAYALLPPSQWRGYVAPSDPPAPQPGTWGEHPPLPDPLTVAVMQMQEGASPAAILATLESDDRSPLERALASLGRTMAARK